MKLARATGLLLLAAALSAALRANGAAHFDTFTEGVLGTTVVDGGITFSNLTNGFGGGTFCCENGTTDFAGFGGFTPPNALGFNGYSPGPGAGFSRVVSFELTTGQLENAATMDLYVAGGNGGNIVTLEAWQGATLNGTAAYTLPGPFGFSMMQLSISGFAFDHLVVRGSGPTNQGAFFACVDNVIVTGTPPAPGSEFCAGDGQDPNVTTPCPCGNFGASGHGCANSVVAAGAELETTGAIANDTVVLHGSGMPATVNCIYLQGDALADAVFGDGVRCTGGTLLRLRTKANVGGASQFPDSTDTVTLSVRGGVTIGSGAIRYYQTYYRNSAPLFCPPDTFNVTSGQRIVW
ncbi:MAG: hypothetical protein U1F29_09300 [Planctomycetota bacterium]